MCGKAVDSYLLALKFFPNYFVTCKMIEKVDNAVFSNDDIVFDDIDSDIVTFFPNDLGFNSINLDNINLYGDTFDDCDPETIIHVRFVARYNSFKQHKSCKKKIDEGLLPIAWHPTRVWDRCMSEDEKKEVE